ncbi:hypothetical protein [Aeromicrobium sp. UC242_57]|uniref:hypothetical protein n=1 Tax=Aeromicrobium sp. UC242_57 TaxID=3374624 RepID=UPI00378A1811
MRAAASADSCCLLLVATMLVAPSTSAAASVSIAGEKVSMTGSVPGKVKRSGHPGGQEGCVVAPGPGLTDDGAGSVRLHVQGPRGDRDLSSARQEGHGGPTDLCREDVVEQAHHGRGSASRADRSVSCGAGRAIRDDSLFLTRTEGVGPCDCRCSSRPTGRTSRQACRTLRGARRCATPRGASAPGFRAVTTPAGGAAVVTSSHVKVSVAAAPPPPNPHVEWVSPGLDGEIPDGHDGTPDMSADGRYVVFASSATNHSTKDTGKHTHIYLRDRQAGTTTPIDLTRGESSDRRMPARRRSAPMVASSRTRRPRPTWPPTTATD